MGTMRGRSRPVRTLRLRRTALIPGDPGLKHPNLTPHLALHFPHFAPQRRNLIVSGRRLSQARQTNDRHHRRQKQTSYFQ